MSRHHEINDTSPRQLDDLVGQGAVKAQVRVALEAAWADNRRCDSALLVGPPGCGKSATAAVIAREMQTELHEVIGQSLASPADLNALLLLAHDRDVVHIDECHEMEHDLQTALYLAIDQRKIFLSGRNSGRAPSSIPIADFTLLLSTTDEYCLLQPLRDRMRLTLRFDFYSPDELIAMLDQRGQGLGWEVEQEVLPQIAQRARGTPRIALRLLQACRRCARAGGREEITVEHLQRACALEQLDELGLGPTERRYLDLLRDGPTRLNVLASMLGLPKRTISEVTEAFLIREGLVVKDDAGRRQLTAHGRQHLLSAA